MGLFNIFGFGNKAKIITEFITKGAVIIDVRTPGEFASGHISDSKNIPLHMVSDKINEIKKLEKPIIVCCASGMRSTQAASVLKKNGIEVVNGGGWRNLKQKL